MLRSYIEFAMNGEATLSDAHKVLIIKGLRTIKMRMPYPRPMLRAA